jgi:hypothetical protein
MSQMAASGNEFLNGRNNNGGNTMFARYLAGLGLFASLGCFSFASPPPPDVRPLEVGLGAAMAIGQSSSIAVSAMSTTTVCATVSQPCSTFPCNGSVTVNLGNGCPLPLGGNATGTVTVSGTWQSANQATASFTFVNAVAGTQNVVVTSATNVTIQRSNGHVTVSFSGQNVNVHGSVAVAAQSVWNVDVDQAGTPADPSDDNYTITGSTQSGGGSTTEQVTASDVIVKASCRLNPVSGSGTIQSVTSTSLEQVALTFHATCDGKADASGIQAIDLNFFD